RTPIGVPVVRPSKTPERIRTWSPSRRWLTKWEVPVRRRSTSACRSDSARAIPGGQPSTIQPMAGPWLSPNVVTVNSLPIVLPDMNARHAVAQPSAGKPHHRLAQSPTRRTEGAGTLAAPLFPCYLLLRREARRGADTQAPPAE